MRKIGLILLALALCYFPGPATGADITYSGIPGQFKGAKKKQGAKGSKKKVAAGDPVVQEPGAGAAASGDPPRKKARA
jgi:hypothetical protein